MDLITKIGTALFDTHGHFCQELIKAGYDLDNYYNGSDHWGNMDRVLVIVSYIRGARSYDEYLEFFETVKQEYDKPVTRQLYARLTGIKVLADTQTARTARYRQRNSVELAELRESTALRWIDNHLDEAQTYINSKKSTDTK